MGWEDDSDDGMDLELLERLERQALAQRQQGCPTRAPQARPPGQLAHAPQHQGGPGAPPASRQPSTAWAPAVAGPPPAPASSAPAPPLGPPHYGPGFRGTVAAQQQQQVQQVQQVQQRPPAQASDQQRQWRQEPQAPAQHPAQQQQRQQQPPPAQFPAQQQHQQQHQQQRLPPAQHPAHQQQRRQQGSWAAPAANHRAAAELVHRCHHFRRLPAPPPVPPHDTCPGVFGRGCGGALRVVQWDGGIFWACSKHPDCRFREYPPPRKLAPELSITLQRRQQRVEVSPAPGAEDAVRFCGGVAAVLRAAGVDMQHAILPPPEPQAEPQQQAAPAASAAVGASASAGGEVGAAMLAAAAAAASAPASPAQAAAPSHGRAEQDAPAEGLPLQQGQQQQQEQQQQQQEHGPARLADTGGESDPISEASSEAEEQEQPQQQPAAASPQQPQRQPGQLAGQAAEQRPQPATAPQAAVPPPPPLPVEFPLCEYERLEGQLSRFSAQSGVCLLAQAGMVPPMALRSARGVLRALPSPAQVEGMYARMPPFLEAALLPFQREGVRFGLARAGRCLLADEMGVGKTVQAIALASCFQDEWPMLVVVPASLRLVWAEEVEKWLPHLRPSCIHVIEGKEHRVAQGALPLVTITSYEMLQRLTCDACKGRVVQQSGVCVGGRPPCRDPVNCIASQRWKVVVVDESHTLRTSNRPPDALHTEAVVTAVKLARRAILLTGTPSLSRPFDLFRQVDALVPGLLGPSRIAFASAYCNRREVPRPGHGHGGEARTRYDVSGLSRGGELHDTLKEEVMLRRLKRDVLSQLPPKRRQVIRLPKPPPSEWPKQPKRRAGGAGAGGHGGGSEAEEEEEEQEDEGDADEEGQEGEAGSDEPKLMSASHLTGLAKVGAVIDWLMTALGVRGGRRGGGRGRAAGAEDEGGEEGANAPAAADGPKFLVFAHHKTVMNRLAAALEGATGFAPVGYVRIDGSTDPEDRRTAVRLFHSDAAVRVALLSVTAAGVGLDFSAASVVVFAELPDEVAHVRQAEDRAHRQGQRNPVNIYFLCAKGTTDDRRWQHLNRSLARVAAVHDGAGVGAAAAAGPGPDGREGGDQQGGAAAAVAAQAGLIVEHVHDAEAGGLTPVAARAGRAAGAADTPAGAAEAAGEAAASPGSSSAAVKQVVSGLVAAVEAAAGELAGNAVEPGGERAPAAGPSAAAAAAAAGAAEPAAAAAAAAGGPPPAAAPAQPEPAEVWFEVSGNTGRVHVHAAPDGRAPLRLSLPLDALLAADSPPLLELMQAVAMGDPAAADSQQQQQQERRRPVVVGGVGVLALGLHVSAARLAAMLAEAREFAAEWRELRGLHQSRLQGRVLRPPLQEAAEEVVRAAAAAGRLGVSTSRFVDEQRSDLALPPGAQWRPVRVLFKRYGRENSYQQPFLPDGVRLCINCAKAVPVAGAGAAADPEAVLDGMTNLFCGGECEGRFALKSNGSAYRRALFKLERGVCVTCKLDCHALVKRLQAVEKGSRGWEEQRRRIIAARAPRLTQRGYKSYLDNLVKRAVEGNAWQADHVLPVYKGGGLCDVDNLRTLCVACHADVTKEQARERAGARQQEKRAANPGGGGAAAGWEDVEAEGTAGGGGDGDAPKPAAKRRAKLQRVFCDDSDNENSGSNGSSQAASAAAGGAAAAAVAAAAAKGPSALARAAAAGGSKPVRRRAAKLKAVFLSEDGDEAGEGTASAEQQPPAADAGAARQAKKRGRPAGAAAAAAAADGAEQQPAKPARRARGTAATIDEDE